MNKILIVSSSAYSLLNFRRELIQSLLEHHLSVIVCSARDEKFSALVETFEQMDVKVVPLKIRNTSKNIFFDFLTMINLMHIIKKNQIDGVLCYHMKPVIYGSLAARLLGLTRIYAMMTGLGYAFTENKASLTRAFLKKLLSFSLSLNEKVFFQNKDDFNFLCKSEKQKRSAVIINGSGVDVDFFRFTDLPKTLSFLFVGRLLGHKGIREYVEAAKVLKKKYPSVSFKVAGGFHPNPSSISQEELEDWIQEGVITYLGEVQEILPVLQASSVCVLPSYREGCPRSLLEAMSVGRPLITTDAPGCRETVVENENGYLVPVSNVPHLVKAMERFIKTPSLAKKMGLKSRLLAEEKYNVHKVNEKILKTMGVSG